MGHPVHKNIWGPHMVPIGPMVPTFGCTAYQLPIYYLYTRLFFLYLGWDKYSVSGLPMPLPDKPLITLMSDTHVTLTWKPSLPMGPNLAPYYVVEMAEYPDGDWVEVYEECRGTYNQN